MNLQNYSKNDGQESLLIFWKSIIKYHKTILILWKTMHSIGISEKIMLQSILCSYENLHVFIQCIIKRYELTELERVPLTLPTVIEETEQIIKEIYYFSHNCFASLYNVKKISSLQTSILNDLLWLQSLSEQKKLENNPNKKWLTQKVFNPINLKRGL